MAYQSGQLIQPKDVVSRQGTRVCGFMLDSGRCQEKRSYYRMAIAFAAERGMNVLLWHFTDDQGCSIEFDAVPEIASPNAYTKTEMRELIGYAKDHGIEVIPELASLGHCRYLTRLPAYRHLNETEAHFTGMCPVSEETRTVVRMLIEETSQIFDSLNFHVGMDEVNIGEHPLTRVALQKQTRAELIADYTQFLHGVVTGLGRRMWMWGDGLLKNPGIMNRLPRDIVICNWQYTPDVSVATTQMLLDAGFDVIVCSALISHDQPLFPGERFALPNIRNLGLHESLVGRGRVLGHINTIWTPVRFIADWMWVAIDLAAAVLRGDHAIDASQQAAQFGANFYGLPPESAVDFAQAVLIVFRHSPLRNDWLAIAKLEPLSAASLNHAEASAVEWSRAVEFLTKASAMVQKHVDQYSAFTLLVEMLAYTYSAAACVAGAPSAEALGEMVWRGQQIVQRIDDAWDQGRFADDSRKFAAPIASFQDDHLIPLLQTGLNALRKKLERPGWLEITPDSEPTTSVAETFAV